VGYPISIIKNLNANPQWIDGRDVLTLGVLYPYVKNQAELRELDLDEVLKVSKENFSKAFLQMHLNARHVSVLDVDDYQGAELIVNLNTPLANEHKSKFDTVLDLGTLEHLSNFSVAITNLFDLLRVGGYYYFAIPANNWLDHGFFQVSPTFFVDLCKKNPSLRLRDMFYLTEDHLVPMNRANKFVKRVFSKTKDKVLIGGVIEKVGEHIDLDLIQTKYADAYSIKNSYQADLSAIACNDVLDVSYKLRGLVSKFPGLSTAAKLSILDIQP
jgi:SAM-dependent methyltransferase